jgi:hypothetical protein
MQGDEAGLLDQPVRGDRDLGRRQTDEHRDGEDEADHRAGEQDRTQRIGPMIVRFPDDAFVLAERVLDIGHRSLRVALPI